jgi:putative phosphoesterase
MRIAIISDTHGLLRPEAITHLQGVEHILHAGDVGKPAILEELQTIAPVTAVRGNVDRGPWAESLPITQAVELGGKLFFMIHILDDLDIAPEAADVDVVVFGHSHKPADYFKQGVRYLNPGSAGPRRFSLPISLMLIDIEDDIHVHLIDLSQQLNP